MARAAGRGRPGDATRERGRTGRNIKRAARGGRGRDGAGRSRVQDRRRTDRPPGRFTIPASVQAAASSPHARPRRPPGRRVQGSPPGTLPGMQAAAPARVEASRGRRGPDARTPPGAYNRLRHSGRIVHRRGRPCFRRTDRRPRPGGAGWMRSRIHAGT